MKKVDITGKNWRFYENMNRKINEKTKLKISLNGQPTLFVKTVITSVLRSDCKTVKFAEH